MACFLVPATEAVIATVVEKAIKPKDGEGETVVKKAEERKIPFSRKLRWLTGMLWGGSVLLAFEHVWHGEVVPWFPFLTAAENPADTAEMFHEMGTIGVGMAIIITLVWCGMLLVSKAVENKVLKEQKAKG